jgi:hypothetical protein
MLMAQQQQMLRHCQNLQQQWQRQYYPRVLMLQHWQCQQQWLCLRQPQQRHHRKYQRVQRKHQWQRSHLSQ